MKAIITLKDNIRLEIEEREEMETLHKAIVLSNPRDFCNLCSNKDKFYLTSNKDKEGNTYVNNKCANCGARSKLGQYKAGGYFWKEFEKYEKPAVETATPAETKSDAKQDKSINVDDIPF